jgi:hypothetical protein
MTQNYYDVVTLGAEPASLMASALLARRGFRVLVLGQHSVRPDYAVHTPEGRRVSLPRAPYTMHGVDNPYARRIFAELSLSQSLRRKTVTMDPLFQCVLPKHRIDFTQDSTLQQREFEREFGAAAPVAAAWLRECLQTTDRIYDLMEHHVAWPTRTFLERREFHRLAKSLELVSGNGAPLCDLPDRCSGTHGHPLHDITRRLAQFASNVDPDISSSLRTRFLFGSWLRTPLVFERGESEWPQLWAERMQASGGTLVMDESADRLVFHRRALAAVHLRQADLDIGCRFVLWGKSLAELQQVSEASDDWHQYAAQYGTPEPMYRHYTLNVVVDKAVIPGGMAHDVMLLREPDSTPSGDAGRDHDDSFAPQLLHAPHATMRIQVPQHRQHELPEDQALLCVQTLVPQWHLDRGESAIAHLRTTLCDALQEVVPYLDSHIRWLDSPHDGLPPQSWRAREPAPHVATDSGSRGAYTMRTVYRYPVMTNLGLCALHPRTPLKHVFLCNDQVAPGLGAEGDFLAAWVGAQLVCKRDKRKERMRRGLWKSGEL